MYFRGLCYPQLVFDVKTLSLYIGKQALVFYFKFEAVSAVLTVHEGSSFLVNQILDCCIIFVDPIVVVFGLIYKYFFAYFGDVVAE